MRKLIFLAAVVLLGGTVFSVLLGQEKWPIRQDIVQNPQTLRALLQNRFDLVEDDIAAIQALQSKGRGTFYYVYSGTGSDSYTGLDKDHPLATLDAAIGKCTANAGDVIFVLQNHAETMGTGSVDVDVAGITIIGLGSGSDRPCFTFDTATDTFVMGSAGDNCTIYNLAFFPAVNQCVVGVQIEDGADNVAIINCEWLESTTAANEFLTMMDLVEEASDLTVYGCRFTSVDAAGATSAIDIGDGAATRLRVQNCWFDGDWSTACISSDQSNLQMLIKDCDFTNNNSGEPLLEFTGTGSTGIVRGCTFVNDGTANDMGGVLAIGNLAKTSGDSDVDAWTFDLGTNNLDHLMKTAVGSNTDLTTEVVDNTVLAHILAGGDTSQFAPATMNLKQIAADAAAAKAAAEKVDSSTELQTLVVGSATPAAKESTLTTMQTFTPKCISKEITTIGNGHNDLFVVANGPIKILEIVAYVTTQIGAEGCLIGYNIDPSTPATDTAFGTDGSAVECNGAAVGTLLTWTGVIAADLVKTDNGVALGTAAVSGLIVPPGSIVLTATHDGAVDGAIKVYMTYMPLSPTSTVTAAGS